MSWVLVQTFSRLSMRRNGVAVNAYADITQLIPLGASRLLTKCESSSDPGDWYRAGWLTLVEVSPFLPSGEADFLNAVLPFTDSLWVIPPTKKIRAKIKPAPYLADFNLQIFAEI